MAKACSTDQGRSFTTRSVDKRFTGLSAMALVQSTASNASPPPTLAPTPAALALAVDDDQMLGVLYEAGNKRFDGDGVWFARIPL